MKHFILFRAAEIDKTLSKFYSELCPHLLLTLPNIKFLAWSKVKAFADNNNKYKLKTEILFGMGRKH